MRRFFFLFPYSGSLKGQREGHGLETVGVGGAAVRSTERIYGVRNTCPYVSLVGGASMLIDRRSGPPPPPYLTTT